MPIKPMELNLAAFQGPFDLLLHLIREQDIDINDIPMTEITDQYLAYVNEMKDLHLEIIGDYLVMAATLIEIKTRLLLPIEPELSMDESYEEDPRELLVQQLLLYQQFQEAALYLEDLEQKRSKQFTRPPTDVSHFQSTIPLEEDELTIDQLKQAMERVLMNAMDRVPKKRQIDHEILSVSDQMDFMMEQFNVISTDDVLTLDSFFNTHSKHEMITTFMAMLELIRKNILVFEQSEPLGKIYLKRTGAEWHENN